MKPTYLEFYGINSFSSKTCIDFEKLLSMGLFGIFGDTGSGKSTILDCISYALYGKANRLGNKESCNADLINKNCDHLYVYFEFEVQEAGVREKYRIEREMKGKNAISSVKLFRQENGKWIGLADKNANDIIKNDILGLDFEDFKKCIALPQGEFSQFINATRKDRLLLISKLFDLDIYGIGLNQKIKSAYAVIKEKTDKIFGELNAYSQDTPENLSALEQSLKECEQSHVLLEAEEQKKQKEKENYQQQLNKKIEAQQIYNDLQNLESKHKEMEEVSSCLDKLSGAELVLKEYARLKTVTETFEKAQKEVADTKLQAERITQEWNKLSQNGQQEKINQEILTLQEKIAQVSASQDRIQELKEKNKKLEEKRKEYKIAQNNVDKFDYDREKLLLEQKFSTLVTEDSLSDYLKQNFKGQVLQEEYACFYQELKELLKKHPQTEADILPLLAKYKVEKIATVDISRQIDLFKEQTRQKDAIRIQLNQLDIRKMTAQSSQEKADTLKKQGEELALEVKNLNESLLNVTALGEIEVLKKQLQLKQIEKQHIEQEQKDLLENKAIAKTKEESANQNVIVCGEQKKQQEIEFSKCLQEKQFNSFQEAKSLSESLGDSNQVKKQVENYFIQLSALKAQKEKYNLQELSIYTQQDYLQLETVYKELSSKEKEANAQRAVLLNSVERLQNRLQEKKKLEKENKQVLDEKELLSQLQELVKDNKLMEFVAVEYLQEICEDASKMLLTLTSGRYYLTYQKAFEVGDNLNGGNRRSVFTLSGGETFLVSLSLALALSQKICVKSLRPIEFFFLDEGFGTLDEALLDTVMDCLEKLRRKDFCIGIISHVEELKQRIDRKILVKKATEEHGSLVEYL